MLLPTFNQYDMNVANYNNQHTIDGSGTPPTNGWTGVPQFAYAINDSPNQVKPADLQAVLEDNGCRVRMLNKKMTIRFRPVPQNELVTGVYETERKNPFINFDLSGGAVAPQHFGVAWACSLPGVNRGADSQLRFTCAVYYKVTFQLKDPR
jgi:hypothetical protein